MNSLTAITSLGLGKKKKKEKREISEATLSSVTSVSVLWGCIWSIFAMKERDGSEVPLKYFWYTSKVKVTAAYGNEFSSRLLIMVFFF